MLRVEKTNGANEKFNEIHFINLDLITRVKFTLEKIEFFTGGSEGSTFTKKELGDAQFEDIKQQLAK